jgi:hypothetical protein
MNTRQVLVAAALGAALAATEAAAAPETMRTILCYSLGAWTSPVAVILRCPQQWTLWNESMVATGRAAGAEPLPCGVDWSREVLLVVAIGECNTLTTFELNPPQRSGHRLYFTGRIEITPTPSFSSPCHVVAIDRRFADALELDPSIGVLEDPCGLLTRHTGIASANMITNAKHHSWGALKHEYR